MSAEPRQLPAIGEFVGDRRFELLGLLGESRTRASFRAYDASLTREVALELLVPRELGRPERERRLIDVGACLRAVQGHPNIIQFIDAGRLAERDRWPWLATELLAGQPLVERIVGAPLDPFMIIDLARQLAAALHACHAAGFAHRDLSSRNAVLLTDERTLKLSGFGHAGDLADRTADVFGFGVVLVELHAWAHDTPEQLAELIDTCTQRDGAQRPSMAEIVAQLDALADSPPIGRVDEDRLAELRTRPIAHRRVLEVQLAHDRPSDPWHSPTPRPLDQLITASALGPTAIKHQSANRLARERRAAKQRAKDRLTEQARLLDEEIRAEEARLVEGGVDITDIIETAALINALPSDPSDEGG